MSEWVPRYVPVMVRVPLLVLQGEVVFCQGTGLGVEAGCGSVLGLS